LFVLIGGFVLVERKCESCGALLGEEDVMKIVLEDGSFEVFPFSKCPKCFAEELSKRAPCNQKE
jgi:hypothetical protein